MSTESPRERVIRLIAEMRNRTVERGATPAEAAAFAAKVQALMEQYEIDEAELRRESGISDPTNVEVVQNKLKTGRKVFNPGMTAVVNGLAQGMCCKVILLYEDHPALGRQAVYGVVGDNLDADMVCQLSTSIVPALQVMSRLEAAEHGYDGASLIRWTNQYLSGAGLEIKHRIEADRRKRSEEKVAAATVPGSTSTALTIITGDSLAIIKRKAVEEGFAELYPKTKKVKSHASYDHTAHEAGRRAGQNVSLNLGVEGKSHQGRIGR